jgi:tetratricopeptide (TPR) repeat protein
MREEERYQPGLARNENLVKQLKELQQNPRSMVFMALAETYRAENLPHQALEILEEGLGNHPGIAGALVAKARCLFDLRRFGEAAAACKEILQSNPENIKARKLQADIFVRLGQRKAAIRALTAIVTRFPQDKEAVRSLEELEGLEAGPLFPPERLSRASVDIPPALGRISDFQVGSFSESLAAIPRGVELPDPREAREEEEEEEEEVGSEPAFATRTIAELYLRQGLKRKAIRVLRKILIEEPLHVWAREALQDLGSGGIVLPAQKSQASSRRGLLEAKAKLLERLLARVRLGKTQAGSA